MNVTKPNILFIMTDQFRFDGTGVNGNWVKTPNLDRIAQEGINFTNAVTNSPLCLPARMSLATGLYPHNSGLWSNIRGYDLPEGTPTWMKAIQDAGYRTSIFGKTHLHRYQGDLREREHLLRSYGFEDINEIAGPRASVEVKSHMTDMWEARGVMQSYIADYEERFANKPYVAKSSVLPLELYADVYVAQSAKEYYLAYEDSRPWFSMLSFGGPHEPWDAPEPYAGMYDPNQMPEPIARPQQDMPHPRGILDEMMKNEKVYSPPLSHQEVAELRANYAGNISLIDEQIGEVLGALEKRGMLDNTAIVFTSDHGEMNGDYGLIYKANFLQSAVHIPLIVRTAETKNSSLAGTSYNGVVELMDVGPTMVDFAGGILAHKQFAKSLQSVVVNPDGMHRSDALVELDGEIMLQYEEWKIALNHQGEAYLLFDLENDPDEQNNLAGDPYYEETILKLKSKLLKRLISSQIQKLAF